ncbi:protein trichome birefringence-like 14 isoform X1 [Daucus carota subsp. sativus]|uniref:protein trichome birefringence-like 14 isoform X1 n=1 Tax=Daucus carota subsp. sativus TaxID=79200 RepID=UPI0030833A31
MKGGYNGLRAKQLSLFLMAVFCTSILIFGWVKSPIFASLIPPKSRVVNLPPGMLYAQENQLGEGLNDLDGVSKRVDLPEPDHTTNIDFITSEAVEEANERELEEGASDSHVQSKRIDLQEPDHSTNNNSFTSESLMIQETTGKAVEVSHGENSSKITEDLVAHQNFASTNISLERRENNILTTKNENQDCNYAKGKWITDDNRPLYSGFGCKKWLSPMWACRLTQRTDFAYEKLRWQPKDCKTKDFTSSNYLRRMQGKTLAFIGDSLGRQQFQSLMCMVSGGEERPDVIDVGNEFGLVKPHGHGRPDGWAYRFLSTNSTILYYWSATLCDLEPLDINNPTTEVAMHLDRPPAFLQHFISKFDVVVLNTGHHWNRGKLNNNRWVMHIGGKRNTNRKLADIGSAKNFTVYSTVHWLNSELPKFPGLKAFYRSISPRHFFNGEWNTGGTCDNTSPRSGELEVLQDESADLLAAGSVKGTQVKLLDITALSQLRDEGHISRYSIKATPGVQDCLHWCLPGVPDTWNELLFAQI